MRIRRHRKTRRQSKKQRKIIIVSLVCFMFVMVGGYSAFQTNLNITAKGNIKEKSRIIQSWTGDSNEDFHTDYYRENIVTATFLDTANVPDNATESWNVSEDKKHGGVMAWVVPNNEDSTKYDLYIGANKGVIANENSYYLFVNFTNIITINLEKFDTSNAINMMYMFGDCSKLINLNLSNFDTSNVTKLYGIFAGCSSLTALDLSNFNTKNVTDMSLMFSTWSTTDRNYKSSSLTSITFGTMFDTSNVTTMYDMFQKCDKLTELNLSSFDTSNVTNMAGMFESCSNLSSLNLCGFDIRKISDMRDMFYNTSNLKNIYVGSNWIIDNANITNMFKGSGVSSVTYGQC